MRRRLCTERLASLANFQIVGYRENVGHGIGAERGQMDVRLIIHVADERHVAVVDDDVNRGIHAHRVAAQRGFRKDRAIFGAPDLIVKRRRRQHGDVVDDIAHALDVLHGRERVVLGLGIDNLTAERHVISIDRVFEIIEHAIPRQHGEPMVHFLVQETVVLGTAGSIVLLRYAIRGGKSPWSRHE